MEKLRCSLSSCNKVLTTDMEIEYSEYLGDHFCSPTCAMDYYFDYFKSIPLEMDLEEELKRQQVTIKGNTLYKKNKGR